MQKNDAQMSGFTVVKKLILKKKNLTYLCKRDLQNGMRKFFKK